MKMSDQYAHLRAFIGAVRRRWFVRAMLRTTGAAAGAAAMPAAAAWVLWRFLHVDGGALVLLTLATILTSSALVAITYWRMQRRPDDRRVARYIEEKLVAAAGRPADDTIATAVDMMASGPAVDDRFRLPIVTSAVRALEGVTPSHIIEPGAVRRALLEAIAGCAAVAVVIWIGRGPLLEALESAQLRWFPQSFDLVVAPGDARIVVGQPIRIHATLRGGGRSLSRVVPDVTVVAGGDRRTLSMTRADEGFDLPIASVDRTFTYKIAVGSRTSREFTVTALSPPRVRRIDAHYEYPSFTGLAPRDEQDGGDLYAPAGTRVRLQVHTDKPIASGELAFSGPTGTVSLRRISDKVLEADLVLAKDDAYRLRLADEDGLRSAGGTEYYVRLMDDRPPDVRILRPAGDQQVTPLEEVAIEARADDDYGIAAFELVYGVAGQREHTVPFSRVSGTNVAKVGAYLLPAEELRVQPGDVITYYARARDVGRGKRPTDATSDMFFLEVRPFNEEFVAAQSQAMAGAGDPQIERLISAQKEIITATWNIERRARAGRSAADVKAIADAQLELKARAEQVMRPGRGRDFMEQPQQIAPFGPRGRAAGADGVGAAIRAMGLAVQQLTGENTKDALAHEMAALQGLLQAQADVRRRQVSQQANGASGGGYGRQEQDLSALFDKELQRQQKTNYETRSQVEERPDQQQNQTALDRIRDLAKRQEDLSRRQRELAQANLSADEMKRRLEQLTREQQELREETERLARQSNTGNQQSSDRSRSDGRSGGTGQNSGQMSQASEQMRSAANDLRRQDPTSAATNAERAAEQLRQLERQMRGGSADARQRAAGELRLEAQQVAEAQRRIAAEAARLQKEGGYSADALRRLAAEKDGLADRVDALQRSAEDLARAPSAEKGADRAAGSSPADAARDLQRGQVGRRMRETAREMREEAKVATGERGGAGANRANRDRAGTEQEIARALERFASRLGDSASADGRKLSEQLDQSRAIRDSLTRLEDQIRSAEGRGRGSQPGASDSAAQRGSQGSTGGSGGSSGEVQRLRDEYARELQRARETLGRLQQSSGVGDAGGATPEQHEWSRSAPGTEAFKQDFAKWDALRKDIEVALDRYESNVSQQLAKKMADDRLRAGGSDRAPDAYRTVIARYFELLARTRK
jgi:hypothetical protein